MRAFAFTLVELLIVVVIIGIIATVAIIRYGPVSESARSAEAYAVLSEIVTAEKRFYLDNDVYTTTITNLDSFSSDPSTTSDNFTYTVPSTDVNAGYAQAARRPAGAVGRSSYGMCLQSGKRGSCAADTCNPGCP